MKIYDPGLPLFSLHVPKCGGQSMRRLLKGWYGDRFRIHYYQQFNAMPPRHALTPGICVHGHFNHTKGFGVKTYYPEATQFITVLRDPFEMALSNYFFWKRKERQRRLDLGTLIPGDPDDYRDLNDYFRKRPLSPMMDFMPEDMTRENYREYMGEHFIWVGVMDTMENGIVKLADRLNFPSVPMDHLNSSSRNEIPAPEVEAAFRERNQWAFEMVAFARRLDPELGPEMIR